MPSALTRRCVLAGAFAGFALPAGAAMPAPDPFAAGLAALERRVGGRLGVALLGVRSGRLTGRRLDERFPLCSTYKTLAAAAVLQRIDAKAFALDDRMVFEPAKLVEYSLETAKHAGAPGMTLGAIAAAAIALSDNTAGNLLIERIGGPPALTAFLGSLGDGATRLDRFEPELNEGRPGDPRDTTTPAAMARTLRGLLFGESLSESSRRQLGDWLLASRTSAKRIRAGLPADWRSGTKTGTSSQAGLAADAGVLFPPGEAEPLVVAAYLAKPQTSADEQNAILAEVGRLVAAG